jgi:hypothetical protein
MGRLQDALLLIVLCGYIAWAKTQIGEGLKIAVSKIKPVSAIVLNFFSAWGIPKYGLICFGRFFEI